MRGFQALLLAGGIVVILGVSVVWAGVDSGRQVEDFTIPSGAQWYYVLEIPAAAGQRLSVDFRELDGRLLNVYVFDADQYQTYHGSGSPGSLHSTRSIGETFVFNVDTSATHFLVFEHATYFGEQRVHLVFRLIGLDPAWVGMGLGIIAVGAVLVLAGLSRKRDAVPESPSLPTDHGVVMFGDQNRSGSHGWPPASKGR